MSAPIPNYWSAMSLQHAKNRIITPSSVTNKAGKVEERFYELYVGSWACTMLKNVFAGDEWIITPEKQDPNSRKKPDLIVEKTSRPYPQFPQDLQSDYYLLM